jgi:hypothetical protein
MNESRSCHYFKARLPKRNRTINVFGAVSYVDGRATKDQSDKLFKCWNCGFICDTGRDRLGDGVGFTIVDKVDLRPYSAGASNIQSPCSNGLLDTIITVDMVDTPHLMKMDADGMTVAVIHNLSQDVNSGCPLCGCMNYK